jgi:hypothetical protein
VIHYTENIFFKVVLAFRFFRVKETMTYQIISQKNDFLTRDSAGLANTILHCPDCGRDHKVPYQHILIGQGVRYQVAGLVRKAFGSSPKKVGVIYDRAVEAIVESKFMSVFRTDGLNCVGIPLGQAGDWLDSTLGMTHRSNYLKT